MRKTSERCHIAEMLRKQKRHLSFHTPGHKRAGADITELSYSDNLLSPSGVIKTAQEDASRILGAAASFFLTDGSTCGVHAMLYAAKAAGVKKIAYSVFSHRSVKTGCRILGLEAVEINCERQRGVPLQPSAEELEKALSSADALLLTSPDYYGSLPPLERARKLCEEQKKPLLIDGAHGSHLHFCADYAGRYADLWTDGVHKSLPALTQGALVSAKNAFWAELLYEGVCAFRTTSPSYPVLASVEYAVKYPRNEELERLAEAYKRELRAYKNDDWSKILIPFGRFADAAQDFLQAHGVYPEFNDGNYLMFYLSPCTRKRDLKRLAGLLRRLPRAEAEETERVPARAGGRTERLFPAEAVGRSCAEECGLFPPCLPLISVGEIVTEEAARRLSGAKGTFGLRDGKILVFTEEA